MEIVILTLHAIGLLARPLRATRLTTLALFDREIQKHVQIRSMPLLSECIEPVDVRTRKTPSEALKRDRTRGEAVAQDPFPPLERRADHFSDVLSPAGRVQEKLGGGDGRFGIGSQQEATDFLRKRGSTGLAGQDGGATSSLEFSRESVNQSAFA